MNLREQAEADQEFLLEDDTAGFAVAIKLTDLETPIPNVYNVKGPAARIGVDIDPETGLLVVGNKASVTVRLSSVKKTPQSTPVLPDNGWLVETTDITGAAVKGRATNVMLDRTVGRATMFIKR